MLKRVRIEVEEADDPGQAVNWLHTYEQALMDREAARYEIDTDALGRQLVEEVIEYDDSIPGYKGRRVVHYRRIDKRPSGPVSAAGNPYSTLTKVPQ